MPLSGQIAAIFGSPQIGRLAVRDGFAGGGSKSLSAGRGDVGAVWCGQPTASVCCLQIEVAAILKHLQPLIAAFSGLFPKIVQNLFIFRQES
jgi:hypothetical protein